MEYKVERFPVPIKSYGGIVLALHAEIIDVSYEAGLVYLHVLYDSVETTTREVFYRIISEKEIATAAIRHMKYVGKWLPFNNGTFQYLFIQPTNSIKKQQQVLVKALMADELVEVAQRH